MSGVDQGRYEEEHRVSSRLSVALVTLQISQSTVVAFLFGFLMGGGVFFTFERVLEPRASIAAPLSQCTVERVIDGDTIDCVEDEKRVRLLSIDSPERGQGEASAESLRFLAALLPLGTLTKLEIDIEPYDRYGRVLAYVWLPDGRMANEEMVRAGFAVPYFYNRSNVRYRARILRAERRAQETKAGFWAKGRIRCFPEDFRRRACEGFQEQ